ncbi:MAG: fasciclin domain-containing protein [Actinobacteria bacterium]|jgi:uncharacterized surface protein with fasciclin (FAS1) repeats|nr:fasciclin domain-containing protein [Actinomycetota bacterium]
MGLIEVEVNQITISIGAPMHHNFRRFAMKKQLAALAIAASMVLVGCGSDSASEEPIVDDTEVVVDNSSDNLLVIAQGNPDLSTFVTALEASDLVINLEGDRILTIFAPTNDAFAALPAGLLDKLLLPENKDLLVRILTYHLVQGGLLSGDVVSGEIGSSEGTTLTLDTANGVTVNGANVVQADLEASNGVIHVIDQVLVPASLDLSGL